MHRTMHFSRSLLAFLDENCSLAKARARRPRNCHHIGTSVHQVRSCHHFFCFWVREMRNQASLLGVWLHQIRNCSRFWTSVFTNCETVVAFGLSGSHGRSQFGVYTGTLCLAAIRIRCRFNMFFVLYKATAAQQVSLISWIEFTREHDAV